jgi:hypothetical protein
MSSIVPVAYAVATLNVNLSQGEKEKMFRKILGESDPQRGKGTGYVRFAQIQANDPEAKRKVAFNHQSKEDVAKLAIQIRNLLRSMDFKV